MPSNIVNLGVLEKKVKDSVRRDRELKYHIDNLNFLERCKKEIYMIAGEDYD